MNKYSLLRGLILLFVFVSTLHFMSLIKNNNDWTVFPWVVIGVVILLMFFGPCVDFGLCNKDKVAEIDENKSSKNEEIAKRGEKNND